MALKTLKIPTLENVSNKIKYYVGALNKIMHVSLLTCKNVHNILLSGKNNVNSPINIRKTYF